VPVEAVLGAVIAAGGARVDVAGRDVMLVY